MTPAPTLRWTDSQDGLDWNALETLYRVAPLGNKSAAHLRTVFGNSRFKFFAYDQDQLVAAGRALCDGADVSYICDIAVAPSHQGFGLGREMVSRLVQASRGHKKIILYAVRGKEGFYRKLGFLHLLTGMAIFEDEAGAIERGVLGEG
jgi:GNAT superfamily N-acetyltransferase